MEQHLTQYRIFYAVARAGNISRAAKELFYQPARDQQINQQAGRKPRHGTFLSAIPAASP